MEKLLVSTIHGGNRIPIKYVSPNMDEQVSSGAQLKLFVRFFRAAPFM